jgi:hypothetical protein
MKKFCLLFAIIAMLWPIYEANAQRVGRFSALERLTQPRPFTDVTATGLTNNKDSVAISTGY